MSALEVMDAHLARIAQWNPTRQRDRRDAAARGVPRPGAARPTSAAARGEPLGPLHGLPIAFKDLQEAAGLPFTRGSPIYRDAVGQADTIVVERAAARRRARHRQDQRARVRPRLPHLQPGVGHDAQPLRPRRQRRRIQRRRGRGAGDGHAADRRRQRPRRLAAQPGELQQRRRAAAQRRPGADRARSVSAPRVRRQRPAGPIRRRRRVPAGRDGRRRRARPRLRAVGPGRARRAARPARLRGACPRRLESGPRRPAARPRRCAACSTRSGRR